jgi:hypothetical protein
MTDRFAEGDGPVRGDELPFAKLQFAGSLTGGTGLRAIDEIAVLGGQFLAHMPGYDLSDPMSRHLHAGKGSTRAGNLRGVQINLEFLSQLLEDPLFVGRQSIVAHRTFILELKDTSGAKNAGRMIPEARQISH